MLPIPTKRAKLSLVASPAMRRAGINPTNGIPSACQPKMARNAKAMMNNAPLSIKPSHGFCNRSRRKKNMIVIVPAQIVFYGQRDDASIKYVKECNHPERGRGHSSCRQSSGRSIGRPRWRARQRLSAAARTGRRIPPRQCSIDPRSQPKRARKSTNRVTLRSLCDAVERGPVSQGAPGFAR
jgi:hypothetical protein